MHSSLCAKSGWMSCVLLWLSSFSIIWPSIHLFPVSSSPTCIFQDEFNHLLLARALQLLAGKRGSILENSSGKGIHRKNPNCLPTLHLEGNSPTCPLTSAPVPFGSLPFLLQKSLSFSTHLAFVSKHKVPHLLPIPELQFRDSD